MKQDLDTCKHVGQLFTDFLKEEGLLEEVNHETSVLIIKYIINDLLKQKYTTVSKLADELGMTPATLKEFLKEK